MNPDSSKQSGMLRLSSSSSQDLTRPATDLSRPPTDFTWLFYWESLVSKSAKSDWGFNYDKNGNDKIYSWPFKDNFVFE